MSVESDNNNSDHTLDTEKLLGDWTTENVDYPRPYHIHTSKQIFRQKCAIFCLLTALLVTNIGWLNLYNNADSSSSTEYHKESGSRMQTYFLEQDNPEHIQRSFDHDWMELQLVEEFGQDGHHTYRYADVHWANNKWVPDHGASVALSEDFVKEHNLLPAAPLKENATEFHYLVAGYHQLHCLSEVRNAIYYLNGTIDWIKDEPFQWDHIIHCIEAVRQGILCGLDPTLIPLDSYWPGIPNGQQHVCRNSDALFKWTSKYGYPLPEYDKQAPPPRTEEWYDRTKHLDLPPWKPNVGGPPLGKALIE